MSSKCVVLSAISLFVIALPASLAAQELKETNRPKASIENLDWIAGRWQGQAMGGDFEETWNPPNGGAMLGMFKFIKEGGVDFYEILTIVPKDESLVLRLKHFSSELVGWEEKEKCLEFPLTSISENEARFDGLTFRRINADQMLILVVNEQKDGTTQELRFECHRADPSQADDHKSSKGQAAPQAVAQAIAQAIAQEIADVLTVDSVLAKQRDRLPEQCAPATAVRAYVLGLDEIDFGDCPPDFASAFKKHRNAWSDAIPFFEKHDRLRGEMSAVIEKIRKMDQAMIAELDQCMTPVFETWKEVESIVRKHGTR